MSSICCPVSPPSQFSYLFLFACGCNDFQSCPKNQLMKWIKSPHVMVYFYLRYQHFFISCRAIINFIIIFEFIQLSWISTAHTENTSLKLNFSLDDYNTLILIVFSQWLILLLICFRVHALLHTILYNLCFLKLHYS